MAKKIDSRERKPRISQGSSKVPLTFYRSSGDKKGAPGSSSPFERTVSAKKSGKRRFIGRTLDGAVLIMVLLALGYSLLVDSNPRVSINNEAYHSKDVYRQAAATQLHQLKNRNKFTLNDKQIVSSLQKQFPEIANARVELPLFSQVPLIHIDIAKPSFVLNSDGNLYVIDSQGTAVAEATNLQHIKNLPVLSDQTNFEVSAGKQVLSEANVSFINSVIAQCNKSHIPIQGLALPALAQELDLRTTDRPYFVKFYLGGDAATQLGQFIATRQQLVQSNIQPEQYLDVRVSGKVFYK